MEEENTQQSIQSKNNLAVPGAIIVAGALIAGSVYFSFGKIATTPSVAGIDAAGNQQLPPGDTGSLDQMAAISASDHIRGNPDAPIKIV